MAKLKEKKFHLKHYEPANAALWTGRKDSQPGERFFQHVQCIDLNNIPLAEINHPIFLGFACDEGIRRNEGRIGAKAGPDKLRAQLAKLACHTNTQFYDAGNIVCSDDQLEATQQEFAEVIHYFHHQQLKTIAFGGGHEIAWAHFKGLVRQYPKIGIINFDAHFDIRPLKEGHFGTSGTPFAQIQHHCQLEQVPFEYCCVGIQPLANTRSLFERAKEWNISYLTAQDVHEESLAWQIAFLDEFLLRHDHLYLSICLDVFAECFAPGVSASQPTGLTPWQTLPLLKYIAQTGKVMSIDIAELSPPLDQEDKTAKLAAVIIAELLETV